MGFPRDQSLDPYYSYCINDLTDVVTKYAASSHCYADDAHLYIGFDPFVNYTDTVDKMTDCIRELDEEVDEK